MHPRVPRDPTESSPDTPKGMYTGTFMTDTTILDTKGRRKLMMELLRGG